MSFTEHLFGPRGDDIRSSWNYQFTWTPLHMTESQMAPLRTMFDKVADAANDRIQELRGTRGLYQTLEEEWENDPAIGKLWRQVNEIPEWVDWEQIERGQEVFYRYAVAMIYALAYHSLLGGMGAGRIVEVLARTGGFSVSSAKRRIYETTQHILQCTRDLESIKPGGDGFKSSVAVRLLHSNVRKRILKLHSQNSDYYNLEEFGIPVNEMDSIMTIMTFSASLVWISLPRQGIFLRKQEIVDYIALWRLISHYMGSPTDALATPEIARAYMESGLLTELRPTALSQQLSHNIIVALAHQPPSYPSEDFLVAAARWLNGNELSEALALPQPSLRARALIFVQIIFVAIISYSSRLLPELGKKRVEFIKNALWRVIIIAGLGGETDFAFKFVPQVSTVTEYGKGVEWRNFKVLVALLTVMVGSLMVSLKAMVWMWAMIF
ncbi:hypothetical protein EX30DRAFT_4850 [Ascodesmis nigricans]|uniref:ER-bound oxygenase mpaB/mpaB'/Rubber oxygenase catalytic domain-containing protein n=1 Tax=Ascodesmis nigricans TaxID=341454 RepID=A0A4V6RHI5_9PEZI|nr:hypothetical protein EX30DRAFT_4850 [Ascodesmis nigricans]